MWLWNVRIAEVMANAGYQVSGSDLSQSPVAERLKKIRCSRLSSS